MYVVGGQSEHGADDALSEKEPGEHWAHALVVALRPEPGGQTAATSVEVGVSVGVTVRVADCVAEGVAVGDAVDDGLRVSDLAADDVRSFTVEVGAPARVIVAAARPAARNARFIVEAIAPAALRKAGTARFAPEPVDYEALDASDWETAAGIVLLDPPPLADRQWDALAEWIERNMKP
jgi:hypothetical protein